VGRFRLLFYSTKGTAEAVPSDMGLMRPLGPEVRFFPEVQGLCRLRKTYGLYQGTTLVGPKKATAMRALAPEVLLSCPVQIFPQPAMDQRPKPPMTTRLFRQEKTLLTAFVRASK
jgi:hypothetical protein